jgi:hypothetical protein
MAFSTFNSMTTMNSIISLDPNTLYPPLVPYVNTVTNTTFNIKFDVKKYKLTPNLYYANITKDNINYTIYSNITTPIKITTLTNNTPYNISLYSIYTDPDKSITSNIVNINGYTMPPNQISSTVTSSGGSNLIYANNYSQGVQDYLNYSKSLYYDNTSGANSYINFSSLQLLKTINYTIYIKKNLYSPFGGSNSINQSLFFNNQTYTNRRGYFTPFRISIDFKSTYNYSTHYNTPVLISSQNTNGNTYFVFSTGSDNNFSGTEILYNNYTGNKMTHNFINISTNGIINYYMYAYISNTPTLVYYYTTSQSITGPTFIADAFFGLNNGGDNQIIVSEPSYKSPLFDYRVFNRVLTSGEMLNITTYN